LLLHKLEQASDGGSVVLVSGEPGIGKTRLASEVACRAEAGGWLVLVGRTDEAEGTLPYLPFVEILRSYVRACLPEELRVQLAEAALEVALLVPEIRQRLPDLDARLGVRAEIERFRLFESVSDFLLNVARSPRHRGLLLVLDDLHWADKPSLLLLQHLARKVGKAPLVVVGTYRTVEVGRATPLSDALAELSREHLANRVILRPLTWDEASALIDGLSSLKATSDFVQQVLQQSEGNPFFIEEIIRDRLDQEGALTGADSIGNVPETIRQVVGRRLARLSPAANEVLRVAAILGDGFTFGALEATLARLDQDLVDVLEEVLAAGLLDEADTQYRFTHALIRQTILADLSSARRARLHRQVAEALERRYAGHVERHLGELAHHFLEASIVGDKKKAIEYAERAGDRALESLAYEEAARLYERALVLDESSGTGDGQHQCQLMLKRGDALRKGGVLYQAMAAFLEAWRVARERGYSELLAWAAVGYESAMLPTGIARTGLDDQSIVLQEEALRTLPREDSVLRATLLASLARAVFFAGVVERAAQLSDEAIAVARRVSDAHVLADALRSRCYARWSPTYTEERLDLAAECARIAEDAGDRELALDGYELLVRGLFEVGDVAGLDRAMRAYARLAHEVRQPHAVHELASFEARRALWAGRFDEAEEAAKRAVDIGAPMRSQNAEIYFVTFMVALRREQGRMDELAVLERRLADPSGPHPLTPGMLALRAKIHADLGHEPEAREGLERLAADDFAGLSNDWLRIPQLLFLSSACAFLDDAKRAATLYQLLLPFAGRYNTEAGCLGATARILGLLATTMGEWDKAARHYADAIELNARIGAVPCVAHSQLGFATVLTRRDGCGDAERAHDLAVAARATFVRLDMRYDLERADALLAQLASAPPAAGYPNGLTAREVEVLRLVAAGLSNREIAEELVLSVRTVERHITNLYGKIDARGKADATAYALEHGLVARRSRA
jgi:ATP/maltotriose-dependent transcriptional regulator MalT